METSERVKNLMQRIIESEKEWKALFMGSWGCVLFYLEPQFKNTDNWEKPLKFGLPASKRGYQEYTPAELCGILRSKDTTFILGYLQTLFSLFEELIKQLCFELCGGADIRADKFENIENFLLGKGPHINFKIDIKENEIDELKLAKESRNCFIHNNSKIE